MRHQTMRFRYRQAFAATLALLPAVGSFYVPVTRCPHTSCTRVSGAVPRWPSSISSRGNTRGQQKSENKALVSTRAALTMQDGAGYGGSGGDRQMPGRDGYASNADQKWNSQKSYSDGFHEGIPRLNTVFLTGYLGQDPKPKYFDSGKVVLNLSLAVKREYHPIERKALGVMYGDEETDWFQLEMWNRDAEYAAKVCKKGGRVGVTGALSLNAWVDREGRDRMTAKIMVQNLEVLDSRAEYAQRSDRSDGNLWESERLEKADAEASRQQSGKAAAGSSAQASVGAYPQQSAEDAEAKARKKAAEDKWWSAAPEASSAATAAEAGGGDSAAATKGRESSWWEEEDGVGGSGGGGLKGVDADSLPSFFDG